MKSSRIDRRSWLKSMGLAALSVALGAGCAPRLEASRFALVPGGRRRLAMVRVSPDRVIRIVVGLRPFRPSGFVVRAEQRDSKTIIHNYGHGGGGVTLSWGTAQLAVEEALRTGQSSAAVLGCGAVGLATARLLQRHGWAVTIYARDLPPNTTSNIAGGQWFPSSVFDENRVTPAFEAQYIRAARIAYRAFQDLASDTYGVRWLENYVVHRAPLMDGRLRQALADLYPDTQELPPGEHPFGNAFARRYMGMLIEPAIYLHAVLQDFMLAGGTVVVREFTGVPELIQLAEPIVVNCTGLGTKALFGDEELTPIRGQLCVLVPQPEIDYVVSDVEHFHHMMPRHDGIVLGGTQERDVWDLTPNASTTEGILAGNGRLLTRRS
jgi:glycine/D-amino acid oxidase-like deaminating enzyme